MSHLNRNFQPSFSYNVEEPYPYDSQVSHLNINTAQQWISSGPPSVQHQMHSPSTSIRPPRSSFNRPSFHQGNRSPIDNNIDLDMTNTLDLLAPGHVSHSRYNPITRHLQDQPWSASNLRSSGPSGGRSPVNQPNMQYRPYRGTLGPGSDVDSNVLPSDSGYHSQPPQSVFSNEPGRPSQDVPPSITFHVRDLNVESTPSEAPVMARLHSDQISQISSRSGKSGKILYCPVCGDMSKCKSELKKHMLKHEKPFKCDILNCRRAALGFATINDLDRHKKSVHRIGLRKKSYQCASPDCRNKEKIWPRLDNFKQHIERMHKNEDLLDLVKRSMFRPPQRASVVESTTVDPMDTNLAVSGMEKSFSDNPAMNTVPTMNLPLDQAASRWYPPSKGPNDFAKDVCQMPSQITRSAGSQEFQGLPYSYDHAPGMSPQEPQILLTNVDPEIVSEQSGSVSQKQKARPSLSNAPQTKAEQQMSTMQRLSQVISSNFQLASPSDPVNLEDIVLGILRKATDSTSEGWDDSSERQPQNPKEPQDTNTTVTLTNDAVLKVSQAISDLIKQRPGSTFKVQRRPTQGLNSNRKVCPTCDYTVARNCDLRKHMKRHKKPYGCTYPKCHKRFGAKSDWKRHENSQHLQLEAFRCAQPSLPTPRAFGGQHCPQVTCGQHFSRVKQFEDHLATQHEMSDAEQLKEEVKTCTIGKNCLGSFWCGFCGLVIRLRQQRNAAWDERFDHIAHHFEKDKKSIDEWICIEENKVKKELSKEMDKHVLDDENERADVNIDIDAVGEDDSDIPPPPPNVPDEIPMRKKEAPPPPPPQTFAEVNPRKRQASADLKASQRPVKGRQPSTISNRYCCSCSNGPCNSLQAACIDCGHPLCSNCTFIDELWMAPIGAGVYQ